MEITEPKVTVALATIAADIGKLREAINSILEQDYTNFELIIFFDGCESGQIEAVLADCTDSRIQAIGSTKRRGLSRALNIIVKLAQGQYIARMDDDDVCMPNRLRVQLEFMEKTGCDVCGSAVYEVNGDNEIDHRLVNIPITDFSKLNPYQMIFGFVFAHPTVMLRREWAARNRYDPNWGRGQDRELWIRAWRGSRYTNLTTPLLVYRRPYGVKDVQFQNVRNTYRLIMRHRRILGWQTPILLMINIARHVYYFTR